ncbi:MAG: DUF2723 domain-containing protein [Anaerolineales bacterium]|nr:DUF2723 domain-containing protein [Anaerolineales bacterium]
MKPPLLPERRGRKSSTGRPVRQALSQLRAILDTAFQGLAAFGSAVLSKAAFGAAALGATALTAVVIGAAALGFVAGGVWGLGLASVLAAEYDLPLFFKPLGALAVALLTGFAALFAWGLLVWRGMPAARAVLRLAPLALPLVHLMAGPTQPWRGPLLLIGGLLLTVALNLRASWPAWCGAALAAVVPLAIYLPDVAPWVGRADTFEFQVVAPRLGVAHPSGYPLYIMLGKVFSLLPVGTVAWRVNLSSAVCAAVAAAALYGALRAARQPAVAALLAAWTLAFTPTLWARAVEAEVYALNALLVALVLWTAVRWHSGALKTAQALPLLGLLAGLGIAAHLTLGALLLLILPLVAASRSVRRMRRPARRTLILAAGLFVAGAALYLYIPIRWPALNNGQVMGPVEFVRFVLNAESGGALRPAAFLQDPARWGVVGRLFHMQVGWAGLALALVGFASLLGHRWPLAVGTLAPLAAWVWFGLSFYVAEPDYSAFLAPAYVVLLFWLGLGLGWLAQTLARRAPAILPLALALATLLPLSRLWLTGPMLDAEQERADDAWGRYALAAPIAPGAAILADSEKFPPLYYLQQTEGLRPDLDLVVRFDESGYREELQQRLAAGQVVYLARYLPGLEGYTLRSAGPLVEVGTAPLAAPPTPQIATSLAFGEAVRLLGFDLTPLEALDRGWRLTLLWQATAPPQGDLLVRFRLLDDTGQVLWATDGARPVGGL